jgi:hypothetical protein
MTVYDDLSPLAAMTKVPEIYWAGTLPLPKESAVKGYLLVNRLMELNGKPAGVAAHHRSHHAQLSAEGDGRELEIDGLPRTHASPGNDADTAGSDILNPFT